MPPSLENHYDIFWSIAVLCSAPTQAALAKMGVMGHDVTTALLYSYIMVGLNARRLLNTLANSNRLARMVKELMFEGKAYLNIDTTALDAAMMKMEYLKKFVWGEGAGFTERFIPHHAFKLNVFTLKWHQHSYEPVRAFLEHQTDIERLTLWRAVYPAHVLEVQPAHILPALRVLDACPSDISRLIGGRNLTAMRFRADETTMEVDSKITDWDVQQLSLATLDVEYLRVGTVEQLKTLLDRVHWVLKAQRLVLDQDNMWGERIYGVDVEDLDACIVDVLQRVSNLPHLQTFAVISKEDAQYGILMRRELLHIRLKLASFHFCGWETCVTWYNPDHRKEKAIWGRAANEDYHWW
ncbi:hypothetical protein C8J57DRAFT_1514765 [Mycena rebaudengoi]|nr:hypothetical protein C8J57DRAFT_1514765 [Mycena rebaudengoi]